MLVILEICYAVDFYLSESLHTKRNTLTAHDFTRQQSRNLHSEIAIKSGFPDLQILSRWDGATIASHVMKLSSFLF